MKPIDLKQPPSPAELAAILDAVSPQLAEWTKVLRHVEEVLRAGADSQQLIDETRRRHEHILAQIGEARRTLADLQAERLQAKADWDANQKRWEAEQHEQMQSLVTDRDRLQREIEALRRRRAQGQEALTAMQAILADVREQLDRMTD